MAGRKVVVDKNFLNGNPHFSGTRLSVFSIVSDCRHEGIGNYQDTYNEISINELAVALHYCQNKLCVSAGSFCGGCSLKNEQDGVHCKQDFINRFNEIRFIDSDEVIQGDGSEGTMVMLGTADDLVHTWKGEDGWLIAKDLLKKMEGFENNLPE